MLPPYPGLPGDVVRVPREVRVRVRDRVRPGLPGDVVRVPREAKNHEPLTLNPKP